MFNIITLICALTGLLIALLLESWLRSHIVRNETSAKNYAEVKNRNTEFWSIQIVPLLVLLAAVAAALFVFAGHIHAAVFLGGAVLCFVSVITGAATVVTGSISSSSIASSGDLKGALKTSYRSAAVMGLSVSSIALIGLAVLFFIFDTKQLVELVSSFALGASVVSLCTGVSGTTFSGASAITVNDDDFTDYTGVFVGSGADHVETYILAACAAALLANVGVDTSGVMSTFTVTSAARYPLLVMASGIIASGIGIMTYRGRIVRNPSAGLTAGNYIAAAIVIAASAYFARTILESYVYAACVASGIIAALISGEASRAFAADGYAFKRNLHDAKKTGTAQSMMYSLSIGMISVVVPAVLTTAAMIVSYKIANFYGIALSAIGINSMSGVNLAVRGFSINAASASEIVSCNDPEAESPNPADVLLTASVRSDYVGKTYSGVATYVTLVSMYTAISVVAKSPATNLLSTSVFIGTAIGAVSVFMCAGLIIRSISLTSHVLRNRRDSNAPESRVSSLRGIIPLLLMSLAVPLAACAAGGITCMLAFSCAAAITGMCVTFTFNNSGKYFDRMATETLGTIIKLMVALMLVIAPLFTDFGGIF